MMPKKRKKTFFYDILQSEVQRTPAQDLLIVSSDLNAKVGSDNTNYERAMGKHGCGVMNNNGQRLASFCLSNNMVIGGTLFPHKNIHKLTWISPNGKDQNQIDHLMINGKWRRSLRDVKMRRGADVFSDHHLVTADIKLRLKRTGPTPKGSPRFDVSMLKDPTIKKKFTIQLRNRYQALSSTTRDDDDVEEIDINKHWENIVETYNETSKKTIGHRKKQHKEWISNESWKAIEERRNLKTRINNTKSSRIKQELQLQYRNNNKQVKRLIRRDKRAYLEELASAAEKAASLNQQGTVYKITNLLCGRKFRNIKHIKNKQGQLLTTEKEQEDRWTEHFREILNRDPPPYQIETQEAVEDLDININLPTKTEIIEAIQSLKNGKSPGADNLNAELFKVDPELSANILLPLYTKIWVEGKIPSDWTKGVIVKVPKKGALSDCNNWGGITLLSVPSKIFCKIIIHRITSAVDKVLSNEQAGFRKGKGCIDQIFTLRNIIEQCSEWQRQLYINFIDFQKAFDSIHRDSLWKIMRGYGIPSCIVNIIKQFYTGFSCTVGTSTTSFLVESGVRQGCVMSALLFNLAIDWVMRKTTEDKARGIRWTLHSTIEDLDFADDLALLSHTHTHLQEKTDRLQHYGQQAGLIVNNNKTKVMPINTNTPTHITIAEQVLENTDHFTYLGSVIHHDGGASKDIQNRINKAYTTFIRLKQVWKSNQYSTKTKLRIYQSCVLSTLLYGAECWKTTESDIYKLSTFHTSCLRKILRIFWPKTISNNNLLNITQQSDMHSIINRHRWTWIGHVLRMDTNAIPRVALHWTPEGKRKKGRPKTTWRRTIEKELQQHHQSWGTIEKMAKDRCKWRSFVAALCASRRNGDN